MLNFGVVVEAWLLHSAPSALPVESPLPPTSTLCQRRGRARAPCCHIMWYHHMSRRVSPVGGSEYTGRCGLADFPSLPNLEAMWGLFPGSALGRTEYKTESSRHWKKGRKWICNPHTDSPRSHKQPFLASMVLCWPQITFSFLLCVSWTTHLRLATKSTLHDFVFWESQSQFPTVFRLNFFYFSLTLIEMQHPSLKVSPETEQTWETTVMNSECSLRPSVVCKVYTSKRFLHCRPALRFPQYSSGKLFLPSWFATCTPTIISSNQDVLSWA